MKCAEFVLFLFVAVAMFSSTKPVLGYTVTVYAEGVVTEVQTYDGLEFDGSLIVGSAMTGSCTYDTETPDQIQYDGAGRYLLISISMSIGSYTFIHNPAATEEPYFGINAGNDGFFYDIRSMYSTFYGACFINGQPTNLEDINLSGCGFGMSLVANTNSPTGDSLPNENTFPDLSVFDENRVFLIESWLSPAFTVMGEVTSVTVVPEPASLFLFAVGALALLQKHKS